MKIKTAKAYRLASIKFDSLNIDNPKENKERMKIILAMIDYDNKLFEAELKEIEKGQPKLSLL